MDGRVEVSLTGPTSSKKEVVVVRETSVRVNDGKYHVIRLIRSGVEVTLRVDDLQVFFDLQPFLAFSILSYRVSCFLFLQHIERAAFI